MQPLETVASFKAGLVKWGQMHWTRVVEWRF